jgi:hypothetical protein
MAKATVRHPEHTDTAESRNGRGRTGDAAGTTDTEAEAAEQGADAPSVDETPVESEH